MRKVLLTAVVVLTGCASQATYYGPQASYFFGPVTQEQIDKATAGTPVNQQMATHCFDMNGKDLGPILSASAKPTKSGDNSSNGKVDPDCLYYSEDLSELRYSTAFTPSASKAATDQKELRNYVASRLLSTSDRNCYTFLARANANRTGIDATRGVFKDISTGFAALTAHGAPGTSVGFSALNLGIGSTSTEFDNTVYQGLGFITVYSTILAKRTQFESAIQDRLQNKSYSDYTLDAMLADIARYDSDCSIGIAAAAAAQLPTETGGNQGAPQADKNGPAAKGKGAAVTTPGKSPQ